MYRKIYPLRSLDDAPTLCIENCIEVKRSEDEWLLVGGQDISAPVIPTNINKQRKRDDVRFVLNGKNMYVAKPDPKLLLADYLRSIGLTGTKVACGEGGCGACTVLIEGDSHGPRHVNACMKPFVTVDGLSITTTEGVGSSSKAFSTVQKALADNNGSQCGYCSPGWVMSMESLLRTNPSPTAIEIESYFDGNICRCTGYRSILHGFRTLATSTNACKRKCGSDGCKRCPVGSNSDKGGDIVRILDDIEDSVCTGKKPDVLVFQDHGYKWVRVNSVKEAQSILMANPNISTRLVVGNTSIGVTKYYTKGTHRHAPDVKLFIDISGIPALLEIKDVPKTETGRAGLYVGAAVTLNSLLIKCESLAHQAFDNSYLQTIATHLKRVANNQVRNAGCWAGNIAIALQFPEFVSDVLLVLAGANATVTIQSVHTHDKSILPVWGSRFTSTCATKQKYKSNRDDSMYCSGCMYTIALADIHSYNFRQGDIILNCFIPKPSAEIASGVTNAYRTYKVAARKRNSHAIVNASFNVKITTSGTCLSALCFFGGVINGKGLWRAHALEAYLVGKDLSSEQTLQGAFSTLTSEIVETRTRANEMIRREHKGKGRRKDPSSQFIDNVYTQSLARGFWYKFVLSLQTCVDSRLRSAINTPARALSKAVHHYPMAVNKEVPLSMPMTKLSARCQTSGEIVYTDDAAARYISTALCGAFVYSTEGNASIVSMDATEALQMPGVRDVVCAEDIARMGCTNDVGMFPGDEELFASRKVHAIGQSIGLILADTYAHARDAARHVVVQYDVNPKGPLLGVQAAIDAKSYFKPNDTCKTIEQLRKGDVEKALKSSHRVISGESFIKPQQHFQMETHSCVAIPAENGKMTLLASAQGPAQLRKLVANLLQCNSNMVTVVGKRMGGAFGSKITRNGPTACAAAVAAKKHNMPVRVLNDRNTDMDMFGSREALLCKYVVGVSEESKIVAMKIEYISIAKLFTEFYMDGGYCYDTSLESLSACMMQMDNCYNFENFLADGKVVRTNIPTPTSMCSPGAMQAIFNMECILEHVAREMHMGSNLIRERNFLEIGNSTPYGQTIADTGGGDFTLNRVWKQVIKDSRYAERVHEIKNFNSANRWRKRGIAVTPVKYGMVDSGVGAATKLDVMAEDGTVQLSTGGTEMGQGLYTKVAQAVASKLPVDVKQIVITDTDTSIVPNASVTGGSSTSECCVASALQACDCLLATMKPYMKQGTLWKNAVTAARKAGENLSVTSFNQELPLRPPQAFDYYVYCASATEVEVDILTGETEIKRVDIVYDGGKSLNPEVDLGQIQGAFTMASGLMLTEDYVRTMDGALYSNGTWEYKLPQSLDIPIEFNVRFLDHSKNSAGVRGSKAVGEPPMQLGVCILLAAKNAVYAAKEELGKSMDHFQLDAPATTSVLHTAVGVLPIDMRLTI
eukprot:CFRG5796T1